MRRCVVAVLLPLAVLALRAPSPVDRRRLMQEAAALAALAAQPGLLVLPAGAAPRWAEDEAVLPTPERDPGRVFRDLEDGYEIAYPTRNWMRTQPLPELLGGAPTQGTRFAAADLGQSAVIAVTCTPRDRSPAWPQPATVAAAKPPPSSKAKPPSSKATPSAAANGSGDPVSTFARRLLESRAEELAWSSCRLTDAKLAAPDRIEFVGKAYFDVPNDVPIVRKEVCVSILKKDRVLTAWASAPVDTIASNSEVSRFLPAIIATFRA